MAAGLKLMVSWLEKNPKITNCGEIAGDFSFDAYRKAQEDSANQLLTNQEESDKIFHYLWGILEVTDIITKNKRISLLTQNLDGKRNYSLSVIEKTKEGVFWLDIHSKEGNDIHVVIYFRNNEQLATRGFEVTHPIFYKLVSNCYGNDKPLLETNVSFSNEEELITQLIQICHLDVETVYNQIKSSTPNKTM